MVPPDLGGYFIAIIATLAVLVKTFFLMQKKLALFTKRTENIGHKLLREKIEEYIIIAYTIYVLRED